VQVLPDIETMGPKQAWGAFSVILITGVILASALLYDIGLNLLGVLAFAFIAPLIYVYILYKRYNVEVITENDVMLFDDPDDLRILCGIYGLDAAGEAGALRQRLLNYVRANKHRPFIWVAPKFVLSIGSAIKMPGSRGEKGSDKFPGAKPLVGGTPRSEARLSGIERCPVCDAKAPKKGTVCGECGADLEFYTVLGESRLGKLVLSEKSGSVRRKLRYEAPPLGKDR
jgi:hypothetical protein